MLNEVFGMGALIGMALAVLAGGAGAAFIDRLIVRRECPPYRSNLP